MWVGYKSLLQFSAKVGFMLGVQLNIVRKVWLNSPHKRKADKQSELSSYELKRNAITTDIFNVVKMDFVKPKNVEERCEWSYTMNSKFIIVSMHSNPNMISMNYIAWGKSHWQMGLIDFQECKTSIPRFIKHFIFNKGTNIKWAGYFKIYFQRHHLLKIDEMISSCFYLQNHSYTSSFSSLICMIYVYDVQTRLG